MDKLRAAVTAAAHGVVRSRPVASLRAAFSTRPDRGVDQRGQGLAEYALILALIAIAAILSLLFLGESITGTFEDIINAGFDYVTDIINP